MAKRIALLLSLLFLAACATRQLPDGRTETRFDPRYLAKSDIDRVVEANRAEVTAGLRRLAEKLYRRNPREWRKAGQPGFDAAVSRLFDAASLDFPELEGRRDGQAALLAFREEYRGDRVLALIAGLLGMVDAAFEHKTEFYMLDDLDEQKLYNCARNVEIAVWKLGVARDADGALLLLADEIDGGRRNLSFEREFGRIIGLLDFLSRVVADKNGRSVTRMTQSLATAVFLPVRGLSLMK